MDRVVPIILGASIGGVVVGFVCAILGILVGAGLESVIVLVTGSAMSAAGASWGYVVGSWGGLVLGAVLGAVWMRRFLR